MSNLPAAERADCLHSALNSVRSVVQAAVVRPAELIPPSVARVQMTDLAIPPFFAENPVDESTLQQEDSQIVDERKSFFFKGTRAIYNPRIE
ncbi:hypothetical protein OSTOST_16730 [Ostertagia ostertagi]